MISEQNDKSNTSIGPEAERIEKLAADAVSAAGSRAEAFRRRLEGLRAEFCRAETKEEAAPEPAPAAPVETVEYAQPELVRAAEEAVLSARPKPAPEDRPVSRGAQRRKPRPTGDEWRENKLDQIRRLSDECVQELPREFLEKLNGGVALTDRVKKHPESDPRRPLLILGEYRTDPNLGRSIMLYGGSIIRVYGRLPEEQLKNELRRIIRHEFTHHIESLSGARDLEIFDEVRLDNYRDELNKRK